MKKFLFVLPVLALCACAGNVETGNGLVKLNSEPKNCEFLYTVDSSAAVYGKNDAYDYLEKTILDQRFVGDSYYIVNEETLENMGAVFGPKNTYKFKAKVYKCAK